LPLALVRVFEVGEAFIRSVGNECKHVHCRVKDGDDGGPWTGTWAGGVSRFLLPTFLLKVGASLSAFLWARRLKESLAARLRKPIAKQNSKLVHG
jgi:hypothetical protein